MLKNYGAVVCALIVAAFFAAATPAKAQEPHYLQALSELRTARDYIQYDKGRYGSERHKAVDEISKAIDEIKHAAWDDGKNTQFAPPAQGGGGWAPIHEAQKWLAVARQHVEQGIDTPQNTGLRERAIVHIREAQARVENLKQAGDQ